VSKFLFLIYSVLIKNLNSYSLLSRYLLVTSRSTF